MTIVFVLWVLAATPHEGQSLEKLILGDWCAGSKTAFHEEFSLELEGGVRRFDSWLHQRPALDGTWDLRGRVLTIRGVHGDVMEYKIIHLSRTRLVVREKHEKDNETYVRQGHCLPLENPYSESHL